MSRKGHIPIRMCIGCRKRKKKQEMVRFTRKADGTVWFDEGKKESARGFYLCPDLICLRMAKRDRKVGQVLETARLPLSFDWMGSLT